MKKVILLLQNGLNEFVTPLVTQISWTNHLLIMSGCKTDEEREFYIRLCIKENYSKRQLERQLDSGHYERYMLSKDVLLPESVKKLGENPFLDTYVMKFLDLPNEYHENDLRKSPMLVSQYQLQLPDKAVLEKKLQQLVNIPQIED